MSSLPTRLTAAKVLEAFSCISAARQGTRELSLQGRAGVVVVWMGVDVLPPRQC